MMTEDLLNYCIVLCHVLEYQYQYKNENGERFCISDVILFAFIVSVNVIYIIIIPVTDNIRIDE